MTFDVLYNKLITVLLIADKVARRCHVTGNIVFLECLYSILQIFMNTVSGILAIKCEQYITTVHELT